MFTSPDPKSPLFDMVCGIVNAQAALVRAQPADPTITRIEFAPGHEDARLTSEQVAALMRKVRLAPRMHALLQRFEDFASSGKAFIYPPGTRQELWAILDEAGGPL